VTAGPLNGRQLASMDTNIYWLEPTEPCRSNIFRRSKVVSVETLRASWEDSCVKTLYGFFELFSGTRISKEKLIQWVENFKERKF
jgi:hypothetical protein